MSETDVPYGEFPLKHFLGMELVDGEVPGSAIARVELGAHHLNPNGVVHGAVLFALVDTAMGKATMQVVDEGNYCASVEVQLRFVRSAVRGSIEAEAVVLKRGRHVVHLQANVHDTDRRLIATGSGTFAVIAA